MGGGAIRQPALETVVTWPTPCCRCPEPQPPGLWLTAPVVAEFAAGAAENQVYNVDAGSTASANMSDEETDNPLYADNRNFYKIETWTRDGMKVDSLLYAGNSLSKAQEIFANAIKYGPQIRITIRQRTRVLQRWPQQKWRG
jgi:hypothetical protein